MTIRGVFGYCSSPMRIAMQDSRPSQQRIMKAATGLEHSRCIWKRWTWRVALKASAGVPHLVLDDEAEDLDDASDAAGLG